MKISQTEQGFNNYYFLFPGKTNKGHQPKWFKIIFWKLSGAIHC